ncbi:MAG: YggT family protein [Porticoccus sp.]|jgi:YggT family protein|nr:MAG: YggT family protein [Porticoccus sp.]
MSTFTQAGTFLVQSLGSFYLAVVMLRFLLQLSHADFYNPISQFLVKATHLPSKPLRKLFPTYRHFDLASIVLALLCQWLVIQLTASINGLGMMNILSALAWGAVGAIYLVLNLYLYGLLIVIIVSWVAPQSNHPALALLNQLIRPIMAPFQRIIPPLGGLDLSPIFMFLVINMLQIFVHGAARSLQVPSGLVPGI